MEDKENVSQAPGKMAKGYLQAFKPLLWDK